MPHLPGPGALPGPVANDPGPVPAVSPPVEVDKTLPSSSVPTPPPVSKAALAPPRVPSFGGEAGRVLRSAVGSLAPGASVWPHELKAAGRMVPLWLALLTTLLSLCIGALLGVVFADRWFPPPAATLAVAPTGSPLTPFPSPTELPELGDTKRATGALAEAAPDDSLSNDPGRATLGDAPGRARQAKKAALAAPESFEGEDSPATLPARLSSAHIQRTVHRYQPTLRHSCWNRQLSTRDPSAPGSARVSVSLTIAPSGQVETVTTSGEPPGYPGLASCIALKVKAWTFPKASGRTTAQVPFTFAAQ